jgi:hypothetical protein
MPSATTPHRRTHGLRSDTTISLKIKRPMDDELKREADRLLISKSELIRSMIDDYFTEVTNG